MLKRRAFMATVWSAVELILRQGVQFATAIALARLLTPEDFGLFGLILLFTAIANAFADGGFSAALIQRQDTTKLDESTVFWFNIVGGLLVSASIFFGAPLIAAFYTQPTLAPLSRLMSLTVLFGALSSIHVTLLTKHLDFRTQSAVGFGAAVISGVTAVGVALEGGGVWALAIQSVAMTGATTTLLWLSNRWRPSAEFSWSSARRLAGFGGFHFASTLMDMIYSRLYTLFIGKMHGIRSLGYYSNADLTRQIPSGMLIGVMSRVTFPTFALVNGDHDKLRRGMQLSIRCMMLLNVPMMLGMAAVAKPLVFVLFGAKWLPSVPVLRLLCLAGILLPLHVLNLNVLMALGRSKLMFRLEVVKKLTGVALLAVGSSRGIVGAAWAMAIFSVIGLLMNTHFTGKLLNYGVVKQLRDCWPIFAAGAVMAVVLHFASAAWATDAALKLLGLVGLGIIIFAACVWFGRMEAMQEIFRLLFPRHEATFLREGESHES